MKKKGFTLIELLAVIVVLAIIALIATPIVTNTIKEAEKGAIERGAENYLRQVETSVTVKRMDGIKVNDGIYKINQDGNICLDNECQELLEIEMSGIKPSGGSITIENEEVKKESISLKMEDYIVDYKEDKIDAWLPYQGIICTAVTKLSTQRFYENGTEVEETAGYLASDKGAYAYGVEYSCDIGDGETKTFYVLEEGEDTVSLIMNMNIDDSGFGIDNTATSSYSSEWCKKEDYLAAGGTEEEWGETGNNNLGPITLNKVLKERTKGWSKLNLSQISIPSAEQIATASGKTFEIDKTNYLSEKFLFANMNIDGNNQYGVRNAQAYWTTTVSATKQDAANIAHFNKFVASRTISQAELRGIRPVITIYKSNMK